MFIQNTRLFLKQKFPSSYATLRQALMAPYMFFYNRKKNTFTKRQTVKINLEGISFNIVIDPKNGFVDEVIYTNGIYEPDILQVIKNNLKSSDIFVDIGANIGQHSLFSACVVGNTGKVILFEPIPQLVAQIKESLTENPEVTNVTVNNIAASDTEEKAEIKLRPNNIGGSSLHHHDKNFETVNIQTIPADDLLLDLPKVDLIKIDTEGHEIEVLRGLQKTLKKYMPKIIIEFSPKLNENSEIYTENFFTLLADYDFYDLETGHQQITDLNDWKNNFNKTQTNFLCLPK